MAYKWDLQPALPKIYALMINPAVWIYQAHATHCLWVNTCCWTIRLLKLPRKESVNSQTNDFLSIKCYFNSNIVLNYTVEYNCNNFMNLKHFVYYYAILLMLVEFKNTIQEMKYNSSMMAEIKLLVVLYDFLLNFKTTFIK